MLLVEPALLAEGVDREAAMLPTSSSPGRPCARVRDPQVVERHRRICALLLARTCDPQTLAHELSGFLRAAFQAMEGGAPASPPVTGCARAIQRVREFVQTTYADRITLDDLARETGLSKFHLERSFTNRVGISIYQYVKKVRLANALRLLRNGRRPSEVAPLCGFADQSHMTRVFRESLGFTPRQYWTGSTLRP